MSNKVEFGIQDLHVGTFTEAADGTVTMGVPMAIPGAVSLSLDPQAMEGMMYADNTTYYKATLDNGFTGSMEVALFSDEFKTSFMNAILLDDGGLAEVKNINKPVVYIAFEMSGDSESRRVLLYNVTLGGIKREYKTTEDKIDIPTDSLDFTVTGDNTTNLAKVVYTEESAGYATVFTAPSAPTLPTSPEA